VKPGKHPARARILAVLNGSAATHQARKIRQHMALCSRCGKVARDSGPLLADISWYARTHPHRTGADTSAARRLWWLPDRRRISALAVAMAVLLASPLSDGVPSVRASEILTRAEKPRRRAGAQPLD
jgi:hypothetical protein